MCPPLLDIGVTEICDKPYTDYNVSNVLGELLGRKFGEGEIVGYY